MKRACLRVLFAALAIAPLVFSQNPPAPKPAPELKKLDYFSGEWKMEGEMKPGPFGPGGKFTGSERNSWMEGGFFLVTHSSVKMPMGDANGIAVFGYKPDEQKYTYQAYNSMGQAESALGVIDGDSWVWTNQEKMGDHVMNGRYSIKTLTPASYTFKFEMQPEGGAWSTVMEGKASKVK